MLTPHQIKVSDCILPSLKIILCMCRSILTLTFFFSLSQFYVYFGYFTVLAVVYLGASVWVIIQHNQKKDTKADAQDQPETAGEQKGATNNIPNKESQA